MSATVLAAREVASRRLYPLGDYQPSEPTFA